MLGAFVWEHINSYFIIAKELLSLPLFIAMTITHIQIGIYFREK